MPKWLTGALCIILVGLCSIAYAQQSFYSIHISSHKQKSRADAEIKALAAKGLEVFSRHVAVKGKGKWYRVYVGKYASRKEAVEQVQRLKQMRVSKYFAVKKLTENKTTATDAIIAAPVILTPPASNAPPTEAEAVKYYLFVGFYRDLGQALDEVSRLNDALAAAAYGYSALLTRETMADGMMYRVYVSTFLNRPQAAEIGAELKSKKILTAFYIPVQTPQDMITGTMPGPETGAAAVTVAAAKTSAPMATPKKSPPEKTQKTAAAEPDQKPATKSTSAAADAKDFNRFTVMLKGGAYSPQNVNRFAITDTSGPTVYRISDEAAPQIGLEGALRFNPIIGLYANADTVFLKGVNWYNISAGPILTVQTDDGVMPYLKGGAVYSNFSWNDAPGKFDPSVGWEVGAGLNFLKSNLKLGIDFNYRNLSFDYKAPSPSVSATEDSLDLSGFSLMATISYWF